MSVVKENKMEPKQINALVDTVVELAPGVKLPILLNNNDTKTLIEYALEGLVISRQIRSPMQVDSNDPYSLYFLIMATVGAFDRELYSDLQKNEGKARAFAKATTDAAVEQARQHYERLREAAYNEVFMASMIDKVFTVKFAAGAMGRQAQVTFNQEYITDPAIIDLAIIPESYFDQTAENERRAERGLPPLPPRSSTHVVERKIALFNILSANFPQIPSLLNDNVKENVVYLLQQNIIGQMLEESVDPDTGFQPGTADSSGDAETDADHPQG